MHFLSLELMKGKHRTNSEDVTKGNLGVCDHRVLMALPTQPFYGSQTCRHDMRGFVPLTMPAMPAGSKSNSCNSPTFQVQNLPWPFHRRVRGPVVLDATSGVRQRDCKA